MRVRGLAFRATGGEGGVEFSANISGKVYATNKAYPGRRGRE